MPWFYNTVSGEITHASGIVALPYHLGLGWHELHVAANASLAVAEADARKEFPNSTAPTTSITQGLKNEPSGAAQSAVNNALGIPTARDFWIRVAEVILGGGLLLVGVNKLLGGKPAEVIRKVAK